MPDPRLYLDYNATAPLRPAARDAMVAALAEVGNASSVHAEGRQARKRVEAARSAVASLVGAVPTQVVFTSGGTEANDTVLTADWSYGSRPYRADVLVTSAIEHASVLSGGRFPSDAIRRVPVDGHGVIRLDALRRTLVALSESELRPLVSVMLANNETGVLQPLVEIAGIAHEAGAIVHTDAVQAVGRIPVDIKTLGVDVLTLSAHKIGGPQGVGAIVLGHGDIAYAPLLVGGGQEKRRRAGTENVAAIAGFGAAAAAAAEDAANWETWKGWRDGLADTISALGLPVTVFGAGAKRVPQTLCIGVEGVPAETLLIALDLEGIAVSSGSACSSGKVAPSHVLDAMGYPAEMAKTAIRLSWGWQTEARSLDLFANRWRSVLKRVVPGHIQAA